MAAAPADPVLRRWALAALASNVAIVLVGGTVRITGSGLGCSSWPGCEEGAVFPRAGIDENLHAMIEFGNRLFSGVVATAVVGLLVVAWRARRERPDLFRPAVAMGIGVVAQVLLGRLTINTDLHPLVVATHFLLSALIIGVATVAWFRARGRPVDEGPGPTLRRAVAVTLALAFAVLVLGTIVTAAGPHAGDEQVVRLQADVRDLARLHAGAVWLLVGASVACLVVARRRGSAATGPLALLLVVELSQGGVGYLQYFTGLPAALVGAHILGAVLVWAAAVNAVLAVGLGAPRRSQGRSPATAEAPA